MKKIAKIISLSAIMLVGSSAISYADDGVQKAVDQISTNYKIESDLSSDDKLNNEETINSSKENSLDNENQNSVDKTIINEKESIDDESNEEKDSNLNYNNSKDNQEKIDNIEDKKDSTNITKNVENEESLSISDDKSFDNVKSQSNLNQKRFKIYKENGKIYCMNIDDNKLVDTGWIDYDGKRYFCKKNGELYVNQIITFGPKVAYYLGNNGYVLKSVFEDNGILRHSDINTGILSQTGWIEENGKKYFSKNNFGELYRNQIITFGPKVAYYLGNNGYVLKSVFEDNGVLRHSDINTGILSQIGWIEENGKKYFSKNNFGELYVNQIITFGPKVSYYMGSDGSASKVSTGWFIKDGKTSYSFSDGSIAKGHVMINGLKYYFDNNGYLKSKVGIDISVWNEIVNWNEIKKAGIDFVIIRSSGSYASNGKLYKDSKFDSHIRGALNAGLQVGIYHYSQAITRDEAILEARYVDSIIRPYKSKLTLPVAFDRELYSESNGYYGRTYKIGKEKDAEVSLAFLDEITRLGYKGSFYSYTSYLNNQINMNKISPKYPVWVAQYNYKCDYKGPYTTWQYSSQGKVNGIRGNVDMNIMYV